MKIVMMITLTLMVVRMMTTMTMMVRMKGEKDKL